MIFSPLWNYVQEFKIRRRETQLIINSFKVSGKLSINQKLNITNFLCSPHSLAHNKHFFPLTIHSFGINNCNCLLTVRSHLPHFILSFCEIIILVADKIKHTSDKMLKQPNSGGEPFSFFAIVEGWSLFYLVRKICDKMFE